MDTVNPKCSSCRYRDLRNVAGILMCGYCDSFAVENAMFKAARRGA